MNVWKDLYSAWCIHSVSTQQAAICASVIMDLFLVVTKAVVVSSTVLANSTIFLMPFLYYNSMQ